MRKNIKNFSIEREGFTLLETIVSVGLLALVFSVFIGVVAANIGLSGEGNRKYIASKMAQEGMELFISKRNNNVLCILNDPSTPCVIPDALYLNPLGGEKDWRYKLFVDIKSPPGPELPPSSPFPPVGTPSENKKSYEIDGNNPYALLPGAILENFNSTHYLCQASALGDRFTYCGIPAQYIPGNFTREIKVSPDPTPPESGIHSPLRVEVVVRWTGRLGISRSLTIEKHIFNTQP
ncbi:hypothetical protein L0Y69_01940 [bacterium]|nr:hypothetical protein [bacterium]